MTRSRGLNWTTEQTKVLAELRRSSDEGRVKWDRIATTISTQFPDLAPKAKQCQQRWDTLVRVHKKIEGYCGNITRAHTELRDEELQSLKLDTAYHKDWYSIVKEVCDRKDPRPAAATMAREPSNTVSPSRNIQHRGESSTQVEPRSVERESPSHIQQYGAARIAGAMGNNQPQNSFGVFEVPAWESVDSNDLRSYQIMSETNISTASGFFEQPLELTAEEKWADSLILTPKGKEVETNIVPRSVERKFSSHNPQYGAVNIAGCLDQLEAFGPLEIPPLSTTAIRSSSTKITTACGIFASSNLVVQKSNVPMSVDRSSASHDPRFGAVNIAGAMGINQPQNSFGVFELSPWGLDDANCMKFISQNPSSDSTVMEAEVYVQSFEFIQKTDHSDSDLQSASCSQGVGHEHCDHRIAD